MLQCTKSLVNPQMTPTDLKTPDIPSEASLSQINPPIDPWSSLLIPSNLHWSPINLLWSGTCPSPVIQMTVHDSPMASWCFPVTNMTPCLSHFWLLTPQLTHSLTKHADWCAYSFLLIPCLVINYKAPIVLLPIPYQSPLLLPILLTSPCVYKLLLAVCQCKQPVLCFKAVPKTSSSLYCAVSVHFCQPLSSLWVL